MRAKSPNRVGARVARLASVALLVCFSSDALADGGSIVLVAGKKSHGPGDHEYEKGLRLLKSCLERSGRLSSSKVELVVEGWPADEHLFDDARTIVWFSDGADHRDFDHPLLVGDRLAKIDALMKRGVGFVAIHYSVFVPNRPAGERFLDWIGGYFDYQSGPGANHWYSKIQTASARVSIAAPEHPVARGLKPFDLREEYYYNIRFREKDARVVPILQVPLAGESSAQTVAWAVERVDGGRGFGYTGGHFHANWGVEGVRTMVLNAILWTAKLEVPVGGVDVPIGAGDIGF